MRSTLLAVVCAVALASSAFAAGAHCYCKLGPLGAPVQNFGEIDHYGTQIGHDGACRDSCNRKAEAFMRVAANRNAACAATHGGSVVAYSAVGTKSYGAGETFNCPATGAAPATAGSIVFPGNGPEHVIKVNDVVVNMFQPPASVSVPNSGPFVTFELHHGLNFHAQQWTYTAKLFRDGQLVEELDRKSPVGYSKNVLVTFTQQPNAFVHNHTWKITWHYAGPGFTDGGSSFFIP